MLVFSTANSLLMKLIFILMIVMMTLVRIKKDDKDKEGGIKRKYESDNLSILNPLLEVHEVCPDMCRSPLREFIDLIQASALEPRKPP